jgi:hypothetical protein
MGVPGLGGSRASSSSSRCNNRSQPLATTLFGTPWYPENPTSAPGGLSFSTPTNIAAGLLAVVALAGGISKAFVPNEKMTCPLERLPGLRPVFTLVGGQPIYTAQAWQVAR